LHALVSPHFGMSDTQFLGNPAAPQKCSLLRN
jgi:hypothetical protein